MTQFPQPGYYDPNAAPPAPARTSGLAITALVFSLLGIIPCLGLITAPLGVLLGLIGVVAIGPPKKGKGMAITALILGLIFTSAQVYGTKKAYDFFYGFFALMMKGPEDALTKGFAGDISGFKAGFHGSGAAAGDAEATAFINELRTRYGNFTASNLDQAPGQQPPQPAPGQTNMTLPYVLSFGNGNVKAEVEIILVDQSGQQIVKKIGFIHVIDATKGDMVYPTGAVNVGSTTGGENPADATPPPPTTPPSSAPNG